MTSTLVTQQPLPGPPRAWRFPAFERRTLAGGRMIVCHLPGRPLGMLGLVVDAGAVTEPAGQEGVALLTARALSEGTRRRDAYAFAVAGERLGATWRADADWDSLRCAFEVPAAELAAAAELLAETVREPGFDDATIDRVRRERVDEIHLDLSQPGPRAAAAFAAAVFQRGTRYGVPDGGDVASVSALTGEEVRAFHAARFRPGTTTLIVVGDLSGVDVDAVGRTLFDGWAGEQTPSVTPTVAVQGGGRRVLLVDRPGSVQSMLVLGHDGPPRSMPDYVPTTTMALALGGMFNSRLNYKLREEKGYTYGAFGGFDCRRHGGVFVARAAVQSEATGPALADMAAEIVAMREHGVTDEELERARNYRAGIFPINFASAAPVASGLGDLVVHGLPDDHFDRLRERILAVGKGELDAAAATRLRPDEFVTVVVGDASAVGDAVRDAGLGPVQVVSDEV